MISIKKALKKEFGSQIKFDSRTNWIMDSIFPTISMQIEKKADWDFIYMKERKLTASDNIDPSTIKTLSVHKLSADKENNHVYVWQDYDDLIKASKNESFHYAQHGSIANLAEYIIKLINKTFKDIKS